MPLMMWTGQLNEKLQNVIEFEIIPSLLSANIIACPTEATTEPVCTLVFDREAYEPAFFWRLWAVYKIAIISYRKFVNDQWAETDFAEHTTTDQYGKQATTLLCEKEITLNGHLFREIRKLSGSKHQTAIISTHPNMPLINIAIRMFARWQQENYFKYMIADYNLDHLYQYGIEEIELSKQIVNPAHRSIANQYKKEKEKLGRLEKELVKNVKLDLEHSLDIFKENVKSRAKLVENIEQKRIIVADLMVQKKQIPYKITLQDLPEEKR